MIAGIDGVPRGWAVVLSERDGLPFRVLRIHSIGELFDDLPDLEVVGIDIPIGLLDSYRIGGRVVDQLARRLLRKRASSVFPAPVRPVLSAQTYADACDASRKSAADGRAIGIQCFGIVPKIKEVDDFLTERPQMRSRIFEVHPEVCFTKLAGTPMRHAKATPEGRGERVAALRSAFPAVDTLIAQAGREGIHITDLLDAVAACWTARRCSTGEAESLIDPIPRDSRDLPMTMWM
jgi:predicted RNase H-like nuclease